MPLSQTALDYIAAQKSLLKKMHEERITSLLPDDLATVFHNTFAMVKLAEEEIDKAKAQHPKHADKILLHKTFKLMAPGILLTYGEALYRAHCRELIRRVLKNRDTRPGTDAEMLAMFSATSALAPFNARAVAAYETVFARVFPEKAASLGKMSTEPWQGSTREIIDDMRKKLTKPARRL